MAIGFSKERETYVRAEKVIGGAQQTLLGVHSANDQVGMFRLFRWKLASCLNGCVRRLHDDLGRGEIVADKDVRVRDLPEFGLHIKLHSKIVPQLRWAGNGSPKSRSWGASL